MKLSPRLKAITQLTPSPCKHYYDLYCDHGKVGQWVLNNKKSKAVTFVDIREHLISQIAKVTKLPATFLKTQDARSMTFADGSFISMCGVGGYLIIECLKHYWLHNNFKTQTFLISANMHTFELRKYLMDNNYYASHDAITLDQGRCYEVLIVRYSPEQSNICLFNEFAWNKQNITQKRFLTSKLQTLRDKKDNLDWELVLKEQLERFVLE